jgi:hypothetical protein
LSAWLPFALANYGPFAEWSASPCGKRLGCHQPCHHDALVEKKVGAGKEDLSLERANYYGFWILGGLIACLVTWSWVPLVTVLIACVACELVIHSL